LRAEAPEPAMLKGNRELLSQALANLVDNAIKYARPTAACGPGEKPSPEIVMGARRDGDRVLLTVADRGPGIPAADRARVVERFVRLTPDPAEPGSGLGLSLAAAARGCMGGNSRWRTTRRACVW